MTLVAPGDGHTCAIQAPGTLWCWGANGDDQLGSTPANASIRRVDGATDWIQVETGGLSTCGIRAPGDLYCWGDGANGALGLGDALGRSIPTRVGTERDWTHVRIGADHACGLRAGQLYCWGQNTTGQLGLGDMAQRLSPTRVGAGADWVDLGIGQLRTCAQRGNGVYCTGAGYALTPILTIPTPPNIVMGDLTWTHGCSIRLVDELFCAGTNTEGELGQGSTDALPPMPYVVAGAYRDAATGNNATCAITDTSEITCWGSNARGQLGTGDLSRRTSPGAPIANHNGWADVSFGNWHACAFKADGRLWCWGESADGRLGFASGSDVTEPRRVCFP